MKIVSGTFFTGESVWRFRCIWLFFSRITRPEKFLKKKLACELCYS